LKGALLDTHAFYWLAREPHILLKPALVSIANSQQARTLYLSPISAWELLLAAQKIKNAPTFGDQKFETWFKSSRKLTTARAVPITQRIAIEAATVVTDTGHKDPGDCYIIATARVRNITIITRDAAILKIAASGYVEAIAC
jgi:PIN domain nuclease of toxin-antitoxin system